MGYGVLSESYLERARERLEEGTLGGLFYAAFELRCGVEARLHQYLEAYKRIALRKKRKWRIPELVEDLEKAIIAGDFPVEDEIIRLNIVGGKDREVRATFYYTPVTSKLCKMAGMVGNLMHHPQLYRNTDDNWWVETRAFLEEMHTELSKASQGTLIGLPSLNMGERTASFMLEIDGEDIDEILKKIGKIGEHLIIETHYVDEIHQP
jgi:hypothetical protein